MLPDLCHENVVRVTRRQMLGRFASGAGLAALATLFQRDVLADAVSGSCGRQGTPGLPGLPHYAPRAKRVVVLWQGGGPSHVDLFDDKPVMQQLAGKDIPDSVRGNTRLSTMSSGYGKWPCLPSIKPHRRYGACGMTLSELLPDVGALADDICLVRSLNTEAVNHAPGVTFFLTGAQVPGRPSMGGMVVVWSGKRDGQLADICRDDIQ